MDNVKEKILLETNYIKEEIIHGKHDDHFLIINTEPGVGKSRGAEEGVVELYNIDPTKFVIMVLRNKDSNINSGKFHYAHKRINDIAGKEIALAVDTDNIDSVRHKIKDYPIVIITHEKYKTLSKDEIERRTFTEGRAVLIIDEEIEMVKTTTYNINRINLFGAMLVEKGNELRSLFLECVALISEKIKEHRETKQKFIKFNQESIDFDKISELKKLISINIDDVYASGFTYSTLTGNRNDTTRMSREHFIKEISLIENIYKNVCYYDGRSLHCYDHDIKYWLLPYNNIILDANGAFNQCYKLNNNLFKCSNRGKVYNHSNWNIYVSNVNVTKTAINNYRDYHKKVGEYVRSIVKNDDNVLLVCNMSEEFMLMKQGIPSNVKTEHNGNIIGRNDWKEYNKVVIAQTYNLPEYEYIMKYLFYSGDNIEVKTDHILINNQMRKFVDEELEGVRVSFIAGHIYQAIKRIDREVTKNSEVYLLCGDEAIIDLVISQLECCNVHEIDIRFQKVEQTNRVTNKTKGSDVFQAGKLIQILQGLEPGKYPKKKLREDLGITQKENFSRLFKRMEVKEFMQQHNIGNQTRYIEVA